MIKKLFLSLACILSIVEGSFRSQADHEDSIGAATNVSGCGAAVIIVTEQPDGMTNIFNGTYVAPGKVLTASTAEIIHGKTFVISAFLSPVLSYAIEFSSEGGIRFFQADIQEQFKLNRNGCRRVEGIKYPLARQRVATEEVRRELDISTLPDSLPFIADHEAYITEAVNAPVRAKDFSVVGPDYCILEIDPFQASHPIATIAADPIAAEAVVNVIGHSQLTKVHDGSHFRLIDEIQKLNLESQARAIRPGTSKRFKVTLPLGATYFSQVGKPFDDKFVVEAVCASTKDISAGEAGDEIWDPAETDPRIQAMIVDGLAGSGVYNAEGELVAIVSHSHKCLLTSLIEKTFNESMQKLRNGQDAEYNRFVARKISTSLPPKTHHPLLNIHQIITPEVLELS
jgi:hypothetical protein